MINVKISLAADEEQFSLAIKTNDLPALTRLIKTFKITASRLDKPCNSQSESWDTPIVFASRTGNLEMLRLFLSVPDIKLKCYSTSLKSPFRHALFHDHADILLLLLEHAQVKYDSLSISIKSSKNADEHLVLFAIQCDAEQCLKALFERNVHINCINAGYAVTIFDLTMLSSEKHDKTIETLLDYYLNRMIQEKEVMRGLLVAEPDLLITLQNYNQLLWKRLLAGIDKQDDKTEALQLLADIRGSEYLAPDKQHPLFMIFSPCASEATFIESLFGTFFSTNKVAGVRIMSKIQEILGSDSGHEKQNNRIN